MIRTCDKVVLEFDMSRVKQTPTITAASKYYYPEMMGLKKESFSTLKLISFFVRRFYMIIFIV